MQSFKFHNKDQGKYCVTETLMEALIYLPTNLTLA